MRSFSDRVIGVLTWELSQPPAVRWLTALLIFILALVSRFAMGLSHGANPALTFYPAILLTTVALGWKEALLVLALAEAAGIAYFLPSGMYLLPIGWLTVGGLTIGIVAALKHVTRELVAANERQRLLFLELQHRVANSLQAASGALLAVRRQMVSPPPETARLLDEAIQRIGTSATVHRRLHDPEFFRRGLEPILRDAVSGVLDGSRVRLAFEIEKIDLSFDQMSIITMLVIEIANNAQKHVF